MPFPKGKKKGKKTGGRKKGGLNKITKTIKEAVLETFNRRQEDPNRNLDAFADENPKEFYALAGKLIPAEIANTITIKRVGKDLEEETNIN